MNPGNFFFQILPFLVTPIHAGSLDATHFHVDIGCHINLTGLTITFGIQNELCHFEWRDSMSRATHFGVTDFGSKSVKSDFLIIYCFSITKNK
jgi:hypothetical protein